ncbi:MAG: CHAD domain-containing protein [Bradyrhizobiaceae bacterium]|nr:CHAD domain-containing protein [Bradyrhizobiaceae bacterium]
MKLLVRRQDIARLRRHPVLFAGFGKAGAPVRQDSVYFDDRRQSLRKEGISLRVRHIGERRVQTIKALNGNGSAIERGEWQREVAGSRPDLSATAGTPLAPMLADLRDPLEPVFETRVSRTEIPVQYGNSEILLALDDGEIDTGKARAPICEVELELRRGRRGDLFRLAQELDGKIPLELSYATKSARGYALLDGEAEAIARAEDLDLHAGMTRAEAFRAIAHDCLRHMVENRAGVARGRAEALHQVRIAARRFRTTMTLFRDIVSGRGADEVKAQLRWLREQTGPARDLDVFISEVVEPIRARFSKDRAVASFYRHVRERRAAAYRTARAAILSAQFRRLAVQVAGWIEDGDWRSEADALTRTRQDAPIELYAGEQLALLRRKVRKHGKLLRAMDDAGRHELRIKAKKLRYAAEFFAGLAATKKARKRAKELIAVLRRLQDALGGLNDIAVRKSLAAELAGKIAPGTGRRQSARERLFIMQLIAGHQEANIGRLLDEAEEAYAGFRKVKPFWKTRAGRPLLVPATAKQPVSAPAVPQEAPRAAA